MKIVITLFVLLVLVPSIGKPVACDEAGLKIVFANNIELHLDRSTVTNVSIGQVPWGISDAYRNSSLIQVNFVLTGSASRLFEKLTTENLRKPMKLVLNGQVISSPVIQTPISGGRFVTTTQSESEAKAMLEAANRQGL